MKAKTFVYAGLISCLLGIFSASAFAVECVDYITQNYPEYKLFDRSGNFKSGDAKDWANLEREIPSEADAYDRDKNKPKKAPKARKLSAVYQISATPTKGALIVFAAFTGNTHGHVGYVKSVDGDKITINHANWSLTGAVDGKVVENFKAKKSGNWNAVQMWWEGSVKGKPYKDYGSSPYKVLGYISKR